MHIFSGIRTHDPSQRATAGLRFRPLGHWDRLFVLISDQIQWHVCPVQLSNVSCGELFWLSVSAYLQAVIRPLVLCMHVLADSGGYSIAGIAGTNPTRGMDVCLLWVLCMGLCEGPITRPTECLSRVWSDCNSNTLNLQWGNLRRVEQKKYVRTYVYMCVCVYYVCTWVYHTRNYQNKFVA
jgi:hypothetical protein